MTKDEKELANKDGDKEEIYLDLDNPEDVMYLMELQKIRTAIKFHVNVISEEEDRELLELSIESLRYMDDEFDKYLMQGEGMYGKIKEKCIEQKLL